MQHNGRLSRGIQAYPGAYAPAPPLMGRQASPPVWRGLDASVQQQLAHCRCDLIRRMRALPGVDAQENSHDRDADGQ